MVDPLLFAAARQGDPEARRQLVTALLPGVRQRAHELLARDFRLRHVWMHQVFSTGDIVQEVLYGALAELEQLQLDAAALERYVAALVRHRVVDAVRHYQAARRDQRRCLAADVEQPSSEPSAAELAAVQEEVRIYQAVLLGFDARRRALLEARLRDGLPFTAIAEQLGFASGETARQAFVDAHARLLLRLRAAGLADRSDSP